jgi:hypothetical protein
VTSETGRGGAANEAEAAADRSDVPARIRSLISWIGTGRKLTQTGRLMLADARVLVGLLDTGDVIDPVIGTRVFRTKSSEELRYLNLLVEWAKAAGLARIVSGKLVPVKRNARLLADPDRLWAALFGAFAELPAQAVVPSGWATSLVLDAFPETCAVLLFQLGSGSPVPVEALHRAVWEDVSPRFVLGDLSPERLDRLRTSTGRDLDRILGIWQMLGAVDLRGGTAMLSGEAIRILGAARGGPAPGQDVLRLHVVLEDTDPSVWRTVLVPASIRLDLLHGVLQSALGWTDSHLHMFSLGEARFGWVDPDFDEDVTDETTVRLSDIAGPGSRIGYEYDFGDSWEHEITVEAVSPAEPGVAYPRCLDGGGACPPEDCGGVWGYHELRDTVADPAADDHRAMLSWLGLDDAAQFDAAAFDLEAANRRISADWLTRVRT